VVERRTRQKSAIESVLDAHVNPLTAIEIHRLALREVPSIGMATIYRSLRSLIDEGSVVLVEISGQAPRYERANKGHHHHFVCRSCGNVYELQKCLGEVTKMAPTNFRVEEHEITLYGSCATCLKSKKKQLAA
jgi:Fur family ferric uptake transcriptional regulator